MSSLRESKKRATRRAIANAAAQIVMDRGAEALTVAHVAAAAGISPRTFHNYFGSVGDALVFFVSDVIDGIAATIPTYPAEMTTVDILEEITVGGLTVKGVELHSVATLFKVGELAEQACRDEQPADGEWRSSSMLDAFHERMPERSRFELQVMIDVCGTAAVLALREIAARGVTAVEDKEALMRHTFRVVRDMT